MAGSPPNTAHASQYRELMWQVIVPVKDWDAAKSRLRLPASDRRALAQAMALDTISAVMGCALVSHVTVLTTPTSASPGTQVPAAAAYGDVDLVLTQPVELTGLQSGLEWAARQLDADGPLVVVVADLPALTSEHLGTALAAADQLPAAMVVDRHGVGTTVLTAASLQSFRPAFGARSARAHREQHVTTLDLSRMCPTVACDVDTLADLAYARALGLGPLTERIDASLGSPT